MKRINLIVSFMMLSLAFLTGCGPDVVEEVKISLNKSVLTLDKGQTETLKATVSPADSKVDLKWTSSDNSIANVNSDGSVTGINAGNAVITVAAGKTTATCKVTVRATAVQEIVLDKTSLDMLVGDKAQLKATVLPDDADDVKVSWKSLNTNVASVDASGNVEALAEGKATIVAEAGGKIAQCMISVGAPVIKVESVRITKYPETMTVGETFAFEAVVTPDNATDKSVMWATANKYVISIGNDGKAEAMNEGTVEISVKTNDGGKTDKVVVIVEAPVVPVEKVTIDNKKEGEAITLNKGETFALKATVAPSNASEKAVEWSVSDDKVLSVDQSGKVTALAAGTAKVTVKTKDGGKTDECSFVVVVPVEKVEITAAPQGHKMVIGEEFRFAATVSPEDASDKTVTWTSSETSVLSINADGKATAHKAGKVTVSVSSADGKCTADSEITIEEPDEEVRVTGVQFDYDLVEVYVGEQIDLSVSVLPGNATDKTVTWSSSDETIATVADGKVKGIKKGEVTIAVRTNDGGFTDECKLKVMIPVSGITLDVTSLELEVGQQATLKATITPEDASNKEILWYSSNADIADVVSGVVVAKSAGEAVITANTMDSHKIATCNVTVKARYIPVESIKITSYVTNLIVGESHQFEASVLPESATDRTYTWSTSNKDVLVIDEKGFVTAVGAGVADITATATDGGKTDVCTVTVEPQTVSVESVKIVTSPSGNVMAVGQSFKFGATVSPSDAADKTVTWSSSAPGVLTIDAQGNAKAVATGQAVVTVTSKDGGKTDSCTITVETAKVSVTSVELTTIPSRNRMKEGETFTFVAKVNPDNATDKTVKWTTSDDRVLTIDSNGKATAVASGSATVTVTTNDGGKVAKCLVTVTKPGSDVPVTRVTLTAENGLTSVRHGKTLQLQPNYEPLGSYPGETQWFSSDESLATVDAAGLVKAVGFDYSKSYADYGYGESYPEVTITLNADGILATYPVVIRPAVPEKIVVANPIPSSMTVGQTWDMGSITILPEEAEDSWIWIASSDNEDSQNSTGNENLYTKTTFAAKSVGTWTVQISANGTFAQVDHDNHARTTYTVNVLPIYETKFTLSRSSYTMQVGNTISLNAVFTPADATYTDLEWTSSNSSVATVSGGVVTAKSSGTTTITAKSHHGLTATCQITVNANNSGVSIGDYYYSDGSTSSELVSGKTPVGIVFALADAVGSDPVSLGKDHPGCTHGLVVGLKSYSTQFAASTSADVSLTQVYSNAKDAGMVSMSDQNAISGYSNTKALKTWGDWLIVKSCASHASEYALPSSASGWYIPSLAEIDLLGDAYSVVNPKLEAIDATAKIAAGANFWCSTYFGHATQVKTFNISAGHPTTNIIGGGSIDVFSLLTSDTKYARYIFAF